MSDTYIDIMEDARTPTSFKFPSMPSMPAMQANNETTMGISNQFVIIVLLILLSLSFLGINIFIIIGNLVESFLKVVGPLVAQILSIFGYTTGTVLNKSADVAGDVARTGVDLAEGSLQSVGNVLRDASRKHVNPDAVSGLDSALNTNGPSSLGTTAGTSSVGTYKEPAPSTTENPVQKPITSGKTGWCLVGEYEGKNGCVAVGEQDRCLSGQIFPSQVSCMNPSNYASKQ
jgi:hypothetical protein